MKLSAHVLSFLLAAKAVHGGPHNLDDDDIDLLPRDGYWKANELGLAKLDHKWGGVIINGDDLTSVSASITIPKSRSFIGSYATQVWVGLDTGNARNSIFKAGFRLLTDRFLTFDMGTPNIEPFYGFRFDEDFETVHVEPGDVIQLEAAVTSRGSGFVKIERNSDGKVLRHDFTNEEQLTRPQTRAKFMFGPSNHYLAEVRQTITFDNCSVTHRNGTVSHLDGAVAMNYELSRKVTDCVIDSSTSLTCS